MAPRPQLACAALLLAAAHVDAVHLMVREVAEPEDDCHTAVAGDACHKEVIWAMTKGITQHRWWYPGLHKNSSTFEDFQEFLHKLDAFSAVCAKPCRIVQQTKGCHTAVKDEVCHNEVTWAMKTGIHENPSWYPGLTPSSSFEEFQTFLHSLETFKSTCMMPCTAEEPQGRERAEDTARAQKVEELQVISGYPSRPGCYFRQPSKCPARPMKTSMWRHDTWAEERGVDEAACRDRKGYWDRYCEAEDTKVVHISSEDFVEEAAEAPPALAAEAAARTAAAAAPGAAGTAGAAAPPGAEAAAAANATGVRALAALRRPAGDAQEMGRLEAELAEAQRAVRELEAWGHAEAGVQEPGDAGEEAEEASGEKAAEGGVKQPEDAGEKSEEATEEKAADEDVKQPGDAGEKSEEATEEKAADEDAKKRVVAGEKSEEATEEKAADEDAKKPEDAGEKSEEATEEKAADEDVKQPEDAGEKSEEATEEKAADEDVKQPVVAGEKAEEATEEKAADEDVKQPVVAEEKPEEATEEEAANEATEPKAADEADELPAVAGESAEEVAEQKVADEGVKQPVVTEESLEEATEPKVADGATEPKAADETEAAEEKAVDAAIKQLEAEMVEAQLPASEGVQQPVVAEDRAEDVTEQKAAEEDVNRPAVAGEKSEDATEQKSADEAVEEAVVVEKKAEEATEQGAADEAGEQPVTVEQKAEEATEQEAAADDAEKQGVAQKTIEEATEQSKPPQAVAVDEDAAAKALEATIRAAAKAFDDGAASPEDAEESRQSSSGGGSAGDPAEDMPQSTTAAQTEVQPPQAPTDNAMTHADASEHESQTTPMPRTYSDEGLMPALPKHTGCYVWLPTGCPLRNLSVRSEWKRDVWGEEHKDAKSSTLACKSRKFVFDHWCGVHNTVAVHVNAHEQDDASSAQNELAESDASPSAGGPASQEAQPSDTADGGAEQVDELQVISGYPSRPGCYFRQPSKCPAKPMYSSMWRHDTWAEEQYLDEAGCQDRKRYWDKYCEAEDTKVVHIGSEGSTPAAHVHDHEQDDASSAQDSEQDDASNAHDADGFDHSSTTAGGGAEQVEELKVISGYPSQPGCYFRQPSKCPAKPMYSSMWRHDTWAEERYLDEAGCRDRKGYWDRYCEAGDTKMVHISAEDVGAPAPQHGAESTAEVSTPTAQPSQDLALPPHLASKVPELPQTAGCYVWLPSGCPQHNLDAKDRWRRDVWGEANRNAKADPSACRSRKDAYNHFCNVSDAVMLHAAAPDEEHGEGETPAA